MQLSSLSSVLPHFELQRHIHFTQSHEPALYLHIACGASIHRLAGSFINLELPQFKSQLGRHRYPLPFTKGNRTKKKKEEATAVARSFSLSLSLSPYEANNILQAIAAIGAAQPLLPLSPSAHPGRAFYHGDAAPRLLELAPIFRLKLRFPARSTCTACASALVWHFLFPPTRGAHFWVARGGASPRTAMVPGWSSLWVCIRTARYTDYGGAEASDVYRPTCDVRLPAFSLFSVRFRWIEKEDSLHRAIPIRKESRVFNNTVNAEFLLV